MSPDSCAVEFFILVLYLSSFSLGEYIKLLYFCMLYTIPMFNFLLLLEKYMKCHGMKMS